MDAPAGPDIGLLVDSCEQIIKRQDEMERRLGQKMEELAGAVTKLAVLAEKTHENSRRLEKAESDLDVAHTAVRGLDIRLRELAERMTRLEEGRETCPARVYVVDRKERGKEARAIRYTLLGYIVFEAIKWYLDKVGPNIPPIGGR